MNNNLPFPITSSYLYVVPMSIWHYSKPQMYYNMFMGKKMTLEQALKRIDELEQENACLKEELANIKTRGRQAHDAKWTASYNDFVTKYEDGMTISEIVADSTISRRTAYRYLAYYKSLRD